MKKKTAIVSCYFKHNYGSMLQAYATQAALDRLGVDNETICIDGISPEIRRAKALYFARAAVTSDILLSKAGMALARVRQKIFSDDGYAQMVRARDAAFDRFREEHFAMSPAWASFEALSQACRDRYRAVLVGSDQLWLPANIAADYYTLSWAPEEVNTIAYATSFGQADLPRGSRRAAAGFLPRIRHLSLRERAGQRLAYRICGRKAPVVADPTILFGGEEWAGLLAATKAPPQDRSYIFCYFLGANPHHRAFASRLSAATGLPILALPHIDEYVRCDEGYADETPRGVGPSEFLGLIRQAAYVCTDSYHCTAFSMQFGKNFFTFPRYGRSTLQSTNGRLDSLLAQCGLQDRYLDGGEDAAACAARPIEYREVRARLDKLRRRSWRYLRHSLADDCSTDLS